MDLLVIKVIKNSRVEKNIEKKLKNKRYIYNVDDKNEKIYNVICSRLGARKDGLNTIFIIHEDNSPKKIFICKSQRLESNSNMICKLTHVIDKMNPINNFITATEINIKKDFGVGIYIIHKTIPDSVYFEFINHILESYEVERVNPKEQEYLENEREKVLDLHELAQKNEYCIRPIGLQKINHSRSEFQRDRERIVHAKSYRRLVDKAQLFTSSKGDHYRTRMTHTLEVSQIARGIALELGLNQDLTEAIAIAHDIGHTPFGHQGERTLDKILRGEIALIPDAKKLEIGGFKHNFQTLRVLTYIEEKYIEHEGLDLSYQTLEGVLKHTGGKFKRCNFNNQDNKYRKCEICDGKCFDIEEFLVNTDIDYLYLDKPFPTTLEGQIVKIADEIAQRGHDLDDAFASGHLQLESLKDECQISGMDPILQLIIKIEKDMDTFKEKGRVILDEIDMVRARLVPEILGHFIKDVVETSNKKMNTYKSDYFIENHRVNEELITFSKTGQFKAEYLEKIISRNVINSYEVSRFDSKAELIIKALFEAYYKNPKLLPDSMLKRLKKEMHKVTANFVDLRFDQPKYVFEEITEMTKITKRQLEEQSYATEYINKRRILARCIADHIGGMTDKYALSEYSKLYESFS